MQLYLRHPPFGLFRSIDRLKLELRIIRAPFSRTAARDGRPTGAGLDPERMLFSKAILVRRAPLAPPASAQLRP